MSSSTDRPELTRLSARELAHGIRSGLWSASEVMKAHIGRIEEVNPRLNAVVVPLFDQALRDAAAVDEARQRGETLGPLAGVPVTVKECFDIAGTPTTLGLPHRARHSAVHDAVLVRRLRQAGAIVIGKTNVPQLMILHETDNPLYGRTLHPSDAQRSPGGSSGGEAAIIAAYGSPLGLASDLGGSIRQPAHSCGVCGFKPTSQRLTNRGAVNVFQGLEILGGQPGPMARSVDDMILAMQVFTGSESAPVDIVTPPVPWRDVLNSAMPTWKVGYWTDDKFWRPSPAIRRAVDEAAARLKQAGVAVEEFELPDAAGVMRLYFHLISANGGAAARQLIGTDPIHPAIKRLLRLAKLPRWTRPYAGRLLEAVGQPGFAWLVRNTGAIPTSQFWRLTTEVRRYQQKVLDLMAERQITALICPPHGLPALTHGSAGYLSMAASGSMLMNLLGFPAGVLPWTKVQPGEESDRRASGDQIQRAALAVEAGSAGLPVGIQVVGRPWSDEGTLALMAVLEGLRSDSCGG